MNEAQQFPFVPRWLDDLGLTPHQFRILCHLHRRAGKDGKCHPAAPSIAAVCKVHRNTVWPVLKQLETMDLISKSTKTFGGANTYLLKMPIGTNQDAIAPVQSSQMDSRLEDCQSSQMDSRQSSQMDSRQSSQMDSHKGYPSKGIQLRESNSIGELFTSPPSETIPSNDSMAETIYQEYPRKAGKPNGIKAIKKALKTISAEKLLETVKAYALAIGWQERRFIPHPATWFNERRWEDDPAEWAQPSSNGSRPAQPITDSSNNARNQFRDQSPV